MHLRYSTKICILDTVIVFDTLWHQIIMKSLDPLRAKKIFIRKKLGHTAVSAIKASSVTLQIIMYINYQVCVLDGQ